MTTMNDIIRAPLNDPVRREERNRIKAGGSPDAREAYPEEAEKKFRISEVFGPTIQGEADMLGCATHFIRFGGCDYRCTWCDSPQAVLPEEVNKLERLTAFEILSRVVQLPGNPSWVTLSGGNPALFDLGELVRELHQAEFQVAIETQGTIYKSWLAKLDQVTISPKPPSSGNATTPQRVLNFLGKLQSDLPMNDNEFQPRCLKVVCMHDPQDPMVFERDYIYAKSMHTTFPDEPFWIQVGNHDRSLPTVGNGGKGDPDAPVDIDQMLSDLTHIGERIAMDEAMGDVRVTPQMHVLMWGNKRGT